MNHSVHTCVVHRSAVKVKVTQLCLTLCNPPGLYSPLISPGQNTGGGSHSLLHGRIKPRSPAWQVNSLPTELMYFWVSVFSFMQFCHICRLVYSLLHSRYRTVLFSQESLTLPFYTLLPHSTPIPSLRQNLISSPFLWFVMYTCGRFILIYGKTNTIL